jgi:hypothetical protein
MVTILGNVSNKTILWANIVLKFLDVGLTVYLFAIWGLMVENNILLRNAIESYGFIPTMAGIALGYVGVVWLFYNRNRRDLLLLVMVLMLIPVTINLFWAIGTAIQ